MKIITFITWIYLKDASQCMRAVLGLLGLL